MEMNLTITKNHYSLFTINYSLFLSLLLFAACSGSATDPRDTSYEIQTPAKYRSVVTAVAVNKTATVSGAGETGVFVKDRSLILGAYSIAKYETTWELWNEVYAWALGRGYSIANEGMEGHGENSGTGGEGWAAAARKTRPVTGITWRDAIVWCNAYSELSGLEPVYYTVDPADPDSFAVLRVSKNNGADNPASIETAADLTVAKREKNGFRLPTEAEWEYAARGGDTQAADWNGSAYAGGNVPGDVAWYDVNATTVGEDSPSYGAHPVGSKTGGPYKGANKLGLFDMSGNAAEWCWDWLNENQVTQDTPPDGDGPGIFAHRVIRGGGWSDNAAACEVKGRGYCRPFSSTPNLGFRVACTVPDTGGISNSGDYPPTLAGQSFYWDSPWGMRIITFYEGGEALFWNYGTDCADRYTYNSGLGRGNITGGYPAGDFQLRSKNTVMFFPTYKNYGHSAEFYFMDDDTKTKFGVVNGRIPGYKQ